MTAYGNSLVYTIRLILEWSRRLSRPGGTVLYIPIWFCIFLNQKYFIHFFTSCLAQYYVSRSELKNSIHILLIQLFSWVEWDYLFELQALDKIKLGDISYDLNWLQLNREIFQNLQNRVWSSWEFISIISLKLPSFVWIVRLANHEWEK
jgi:hypothetical protein